MEGGHRFVLHASGINAGAAIGIDLSVHNSSRAIVRRMVRAEVRRPFRVRSAAELQGVSLGRARFERHFELDCSFGRRWWRHRQRSLVRDRWLSADSLYRSMSRLGGVDSCPSWMVGGATRRQRQVVRVRPSGRSRVRRWAATGSSGPRAEVAGTALDGNIRRCCVRACRERTLGSRPHQERQSGLGRPSSTALGLCEREVPAHRVSMYRSLFRAVARRRIRTVQPDARPSTVASLRTVGGISGGNTGELSGAGGRLSDGLDSSFIGHVSARASRSPSRVAVRAAFGFGALGSCSRRR